MTFVGRAVMLGGDEEFVAGDHDPAVRGGERGGRQNNLLREIRGGIESRYFATRERDGDRGRRVVVHERGFTGQRQRHVAADGSYPQRGFLRDPAPRARGPWIVLGLVPAIIGAEH